MSRCAKQTELHEECYILNGLSYFLHVLESFGTLAKIKSFPSSKTYVDFVGNKNTTHTTIIALHVFRYQKPNDCMDIYTSRMILRTCIVFNSEICFTVWNSPHSSVPRHCKGLLVLSQLWHRNAGRKVHTITKNGDRIQTSLNVFLQNFLYRNFSRLNRFHRKTEAW